MEELMLEYEEYIRAKKRILQNQRGKGRQMKREPVKLTRFQAIKLAILFYFKEGDRYVIWLGILAALLLILVVAKHGGFSWQRFIIGWSSSRYGLDGRHADY